MAGEGVFVSQTLDMTNPNAVLDRAAQYYQTTERSILKMISWLKAAPSTDIARSGLPILSSELRWVQAQQEILRQIRMDPSPGTARQAYNTARAKLDNILDLESKIKVTIAQQSRPSITAPREITLDPEFPSIDDMPSSLPSVRMPVYGSTGSSIPTGGAVGGSLGTRPSVLTSATTPGPGKEPTFFKVDEMWRFLNKVAGTYASGEKARLHASLLAHQAAGEPVQVTPLLRQEVQRSNIPWGWIALGVVVVGGVMFAATRPRQSEAVAAAPMKQLPAPV